jgi:glycine cleavage system H protein
MNIPQNLLYTDKHEWVSFEGDFALIGITDHAQEALGDIVFASLPQVGDTLAAGDSIAELESVKAASSVYAPVGGTVVEINDALTGAPEAINQDPYGSWLVKLSGYEKNDGLMDAAAYEKFVAEEEA